MWRQWAPERVAVTGPLGVPPDPPAEYPDLRLEARGLAEDPGLLAAYPGLPLEALDPPALDLGLLLDTLALLARPRAARSPPAQTTAPGAPEQAATRVTKRPRRTRILPL